MRSRLLLVRIAIGLLIIVGLAAYAWYPPPGIPQGPADRIVVSKSRHTLTLFKDGQEIRSYPVSIGRHPLGAKTQSGDHKTPEGTYQIDGRNPKSGFHLALHVSYPNLQDRLRANSLGVNPGGNIMIHGTKKNWGGSDVFIFGSIGLMDASQ